MAEWQDEVERRVWTVRVIIGSLLLSSLLFLGVTVAIGQLGRAPAVAGESTLITWLAAIVALVAIGARMLVPSLIVASNRQAIIQGTDFLMQSAADSPSVAEFLRQTGDAGRVWLGFLTKTIIGGSILEGAILFNLIAYLTEQSPLSLILAAILWLGLAFHLPTRAGVVHWIEDQLNLIAQQRQLRN